MDSEPAPPSPAEPAAETVLCKHGLEHKGGRWWCMQPFGHAGPHDPLPHTTAGGLGKRERKERKLLAAEEEGPQFKKSKVKEEEPVDPDDEDGCVHLDSPVGGGLSSSSAKPAAAPLRQKGKVAEKVAAQAVLQRLQSRAAESSSSAGKQSHCCERSRQPPSPQWWR